MGLENVEILWDGFDRYGTVGDILIFANAGTQNNGDCLTFLQGEWSGVFGTWTMTNGGSGYMMLASGRFSGRALRLRCDAQGGGVGPASICGIYRNLPSNYAHLIGGFAYHADLTAPGGVTLTDAATDQLSIIVNKVGTIEVRNGAPNGTVVATSTASVAQGAWHYIEFDVVINNTTGSYTIYLDGVSIITASSQNTRQSSNNYANILKVTANFSSGLGGGVGSVYFDDLYLFDNTGGSNNAVLGDSRVELLLPSSDSSPLNFSFGSGVLGTGFYNGNPGTTNAPGANKLALRKYTNIPTSSLASVGIMPAATSIIAKFKGVVYADNGSGTAPTGAPLSTGTEVVGCTSSTAMTLPFSPSQSLTASTIYWIGYITDTSIVLNESDANNNGFSAVNTYANGAPTSPSMTSAQASWQIWGNLSGISTHYTETNVSPPPGDLNYVVDSVVSDEDLYGTGSLSSTPTTIAGVKVFSYCKKADAGTRTITLQCKSGATDSASSAQTPTANYAFLAGYFDNDPATGAAWATASAVNNATVGVKINT